MSVVLRWSVSFTIKSSEGETCFLLSCFRFVEQNDVKICFKQIMLSVFSSDLYNIICHVIIRNHLSLSMGSRGVAAGANPSLVSGRGQSAPWTSRQLIAGPSPMSNVGFSISLKDTSTCSAALPGAGIWTSDLLITNPALSTELQPPHNII